MSIIRNTHINFYHKFPFIVSSNTHDFMIFSDSSYFLQYFLNNFYNYNDIFYKIYSDFRYCNSKFYTSYPYFNYFIPKEECYINDIYLNVYSITRLFIMLFYKLNYYTKIDSITKSYNYILFINKCFIEIYHFRVGVAETTFCTPVILLLIKLFRYSIFFMYNDLNG